MSVPARDDFTGSVHTSALLEKVTDTIWLSIKTWEDPGRDGLQ